MRCDDLTRWLDEGMPPGGAVTIGSARAHAASCERCARALAAAATIERALSASPPAPASGAEPFVASVLARIAAEPRAAAGPRSAAEPRAEARPAARLGWALLSEPAFVVGAVALATYLLAPSMIERDSGSSLGVGATVVAQALGSALQSLAQPLFGSPSPPPALSPAAQAAFAVIVAALLVAGGLWIAGTIDRWIRPGAERRM
ncbi:MAG TPA: hypothetical protein VFT32_03145 [Candidatus Eisenbacteria bacterium]|nr:hypothetical protein [Candidatus Eisenbacteria bacterium]